MFRKEIVSLIVLFFCICSLQAAQINSTWVGGSLGQWETASNWSPAIVPENGTNTFYVTINGGSNGVDVDLHGNHTITKLDCYAEVELGSGEWWHPDMSVLNGTTNHGKFHTYEIDMHGQITNLSGATFKAKGGSEIDGANLYNQAGGTLIASSGQGTFDIYGGIIQNDGTMVITANSETWAESGIQNSSTMLMVGGTLTSDETFTNNSGATIKGFGTILPSFLDNAGIICSDGGSLTLFSFLGITNTGTLRNNAGTSLTVMALALPDVNNQGTIEVNADGAVAFDCNNLNNKSMGIIKLYGGTLSAGNITEENGAMFQGFGTIKGNVVDKGLINITGPSSIVGNVTVNNGATLEIRDGQTLITGQTTNNGTIHLIGGTVIFQGGYTGSGNITHEAGTYRNHFDVNADGIEDFKDFAYFANTWLWEATWY